MKLSIRSPAKLNLFLHITGRRPDGYHNLQTLFQFIDFYDRMEFEPSDSSNLHLTPALDGVPNDSNLIVRAARLLQDHTGCQQGARIHLDKQLPMGGGLGGGSSNAASTLVALNHLWQLGLDKTALAGLGLRLGADVPVFVHGHSALAEGVGEQLKSVDIPEPWYILAIPDCHASTAELFQEKQLTRNSKLIKIRDFLTGGGHNDFEPVLRKRFPIIDRCMQLMDSTAQARARVTGSGACLFTRCETESEAKRILQQNLLNMAQFQLANQDVSWKIAKGCNRSPLYSGVLAEQG